MPPPTLSDDDLVAGIEGLTLANEAFHHVDHLRLAWIFARRHEADRAADRMAAALRAFATHHGRAERYHETLTRAWMHFVIAGAPRAADTESFDAFLDRNPALRDPRLPWRHYSEDRLSADEARLRFLAPDRSPFPVPYSHSI